jgi:general secretion pathway protein G
LKAVAFSFLFLLIAGGVFVARTTDLYWRHLKNAKEVVLQRNLWTMRRAIDFYSQDKEKAPQSLQELVDTGYLREIPADPITGSNKTWITQPEPESSVLHTPTGIGDVKSGATGADKNGKPYNQY